MPYYRAADPPETQPQLLACRIAGCFLQPRLEAVTDEHFRSREGSVQAISQHKHPVLHCVVYTDGRGACRLDGHLLRCRPGDCVLVDPDQPHQFGAVAPERCSYRAITLSLIDDLGQASPYGWSDWLSALAGRSHQLKQQPCRLPASAFQAYLERQRSLIDILCHEQGVDWHNAQRCLYDILMLLAEHAFEQDVMNEQDNAMQRARMLVEQRYPQPLPVANLAREVGCSTGAFHRRFKAAFGISPTALQLQLRIRAARTLLDASSLPCKAIAERVGFADSAAFSKAFRKQLGISPQQWRNSQA